MLHRRCLEDDHKGVNQVLNETTHIEPRMWLLYDTSDYVSLLNRRLFNLQQFHPIDFWSLTTNSISQWTSSYNVLFNGMGSEYNVSGLPMNVHLQEFRYGYSGESYNDGLIMQFEHLFEINENSEYSNNVTIDINNVISSNILSINSSIEMTLTANLPLSELNRLSWNIKDNDGNVKKVNDGSDIKRKLKSVKSGSQSSSSLTLNARDIRTFVINSNVDKKFRQGRLKMDGKTTMLTEKMLKQW